MLKEQKRSLASCHSAGSKSENQQTWQIYYSRFSIGSSMYHQILCRVVSLPIDINNPTVEQLDAERYADLNEGKEADLAHIAGWFIPDQYSEQGSDSKLPSLSCLYHPCILKLSRFLVFRHDLNHHLHSLKAYIELGISVQQSSCSLLRLTFAIRHLALALNWTIAHNLQKGRRLIQLEQAVEISMLLDSATRQGKTRRTTQRLIKQWKNRPSALSRRLSRSLRECLCHHQCRCTR